MFLKIKTQKDRTKTPNIEINSPITLGNPFRTFRNNSIQQQQSNSSVGPEQNTTIPASSLATYIKQKKSQLLIQESFINYIKHRKRKKSIEMQIQQKHHHHHHAKSKSSQSQSKNSKVKNKMQLLKFIMKKPFFSQLGSKLVQQLCQKIQYLEVEPGQYIYKIGDFANHVYILVDGKIDLMIPQLKQQDSTAPQEKNQLQQLILSRKFTYNQQISISQKSSIKLFHNHSDKIALCQAITQPPKRDMLIKLKTVKSIGKWESFGQFKIQNPQKRTVSALAKSYSQLLVIKRQQYELVIRAGQTTSTLQKFTFIHSLPLFRKMFRPSLENLIYHMDCMEQSYGQKLYVQGSDIQHLYILVQGQLLLTKKVMMKYLQCSINSRAESTWDKRYHGDQATNNLKVVTPYEKQLPFLKLLKGQILNDADLILNNKTHEDTCIVNSQKAILYALPKQLFLERILSAQNQVASIKEYCRQKSIRKKETITNFTMKYFQDDMFVKFLARKSTKISATQRKMIIRKNCRSMTLSHQDKFKNQQDEVHQRKTYTSLQRRQNKIPPQFAFFKEFNSTFKQSKSNSRVKIRRSFSESKKKTQKNLDESGNQMQSIPAAVQDIVKIVSFKEKYEKIRQISESKRSFQIDLSNVPLYVQKKYEGFFKMQKNKKK